MFLLMRTRLASISLLVAAALQPAAALAARTSSPSHKQIRAAVKQVERSKDLWATINICNTRRHPNAVGIRAQMPGLGFRAKLSMEFQIVYWSVAQKKFKPVQGAHKVISLGSERTGLHQDGVTFRFAPHAGFLASNVSFVWTLGRRSIARLTRQTSSGHREADGGDPPHFTAGRCAIR
jgi:hypothetical protein